MKQCYKCYDKFDKSNPDEFHTCVCPTCIKIDQENNKREDEEAMHHEQEWERQQAYLDGTVWIDEDDYDQ